MSGRRLNSRLYTSSSVPVAVHGVVEGLHADAIRELYIGGPRSRRPASRGHGGSRDADAKHGTFFLHPSCCGGILSRSACALVSAAITSTSALEHLCVDVSAVSTSSLKSLLNAAAAVAATGGSSHARRVTVMGGLTILDGRAIAEALTNSQSPSLRIPSHSPSPRTAAGSRKQNNPHAALRHARPLNPITGAVGAPSSSPAAHRRSPSDCVALAEGGLAWRVRVGDSGGGKPVAIGSPGQMQHGRQPFTPRVGKGERDGAFHRRAVDPVSRLVPGTMATNTTTTMAAPLFNGPGLELVLHPGHLDDATARVLVHGVRLACRVTEARVRPLSGEAAYATGGTAAAITRDTILSGRASRELAKTLNAQLTEICAPRKEAWAASMAATVRRADSPRFHAVADHLMDPQHRQHPVPTPMKHGEIAPLHHQSYNQRHGLQQAPAPPPTPPLDQRAFIHHGPHHNHPKHLRSMATPPSERQHPQTSLHSTAETPSSGTPPPLVGRRRFLAQPNFNRRCSRPESVEEPSAANGDTCALRRYSPPQWLRPRQAQPRPLMTPPSSGGRQRQQLPPPPRSPPMRLWQPQLKPQPRQQSPFNRSASAATSWTVEDASPTPSPPPRRPSTPPERKPRLRGGRLGATGAAGAFATDTAAPALLHQPHTPLKEGPMPPATPTTPLLCVSPRYARRTAGPTLPTPPILPYVRLRGRRTAAAAAAAPVETSDATEAVHTARRWGPALLDTPPVFPSPRSSSRSSPTLAAEEKTRERRVTRQTPPTPPMLTSTPTSTPLSTTVAPTKAVAASEANCTDGDSCFVCQHRELAQEVVHATPPSPRRRTSPREGTDSASSGLSSLPKADCAVKPLPHGSFPAPRTLIYPGTSHTNEFGIIDNSSAAQRMSIEDILAAAERTARELKQRAHPLLNTPPSSQGVTASREADQQVAAAVTPPQQHQSTCAAARLTPLPPLSTEDYACVQPQCPKRVGASAAPSNESTSGCSAQSALNASGSTLVREYPSLEPTPRLYRNSPLHQDTQPGERWVGHRHVNTSMCRSWLDDCCTGADKRVEAGDGFAATATREGFWVVPAAALQGLVACVEGLRQDLVLYTERVDTETRAMLMRLGAANRAITAQSAARLADVRNVVDAMALLPGHPQ